MNRYLEDMCWFLMGCGIGAVIVTIGELLKVP